MNSLLRKLQQLISPLVPIPDLDEYRQSQILASISLAVLFAALIGILFSSPSYSSIQIINIAPVIAGFLLLLIPYYQSRRGHLQTSALTMALISTFLITIAAVRLGADVGRDTLHYLSLIIMFSLVFLTHKHTLFFIILTFVMIIVFGVLSPSLSMVEVVRGPLLFNMIASFFLVLLTTLWRRREIEKRYYLQVSERQKAQLLLKREQYGILSQFVGAISHDLRTRLSQIETNRYLVKRLLEQNEPDERTAQRLDNIQNIIQEIDQQISNLNVIANLGNPKIESVDLNHIVDTVYNAMQPASNQQGIELEQEIKPSPIHIKGNTDHLQLAISHLVKNAINYSNEGNVVVLTTMQTDTQGCIRVADTGIGIHPDHLDHIFDIFYKTDTARTTTYSGLGLGLTIVKLITEAYSGRVEIDSTVGEGSTFTLHFPLESPKTVDNEVDD